MKSKLKIPGFAIIVILIAFIGLAAKGIKPGMKGIRYVLASISKARSSETSQGIKFEGVMRSRESSSRGVELGNSISDYQVIIENNMLRPLGWQRDTTPRIPVVQRREREPEKRPEPVSDLVFTGIVNLDGQKVALVEDVPERKAYFLKEGDMLKDHIVEAIGEENIVLANDDSSIEYVLGSKAYYKPGEQILVSEPTGAQMTMAVVKNVSEESVPINEQSSSSSLIEQMRARRRKELGQE